MSVFAQVSDAHVLGIDFGSECVKIAGPQGNRGIDIVLNELSQRKTDNFIGFRMGERYVGSSAKALAARFPLQTASAVNKLLIDPSSGQYKTLMEYYYEYVIDADSNNSLSVPISDAHGPFTALELNGMMLSYSKKIALLEGVPDPKSVVIVVPARSSLHDRKLMIHAAKLGGLNVLALVDSVTATAYYYGMRHRGFANKTVLLAIIDVGASKTEVGVFRIFPSETNGTRKKGLGIIEKLAVSTDFSFSGRALDLCVARIIEEEATKKLNIPKIIGETSKEGLKSQFSLLRASKKVRETLSVNSETPYTVEGITAARDFSSSFSKLTFESKCSSLFQKVPLLVQQALKESNASLESLTAIELMGGVSRTPKLITDLTQLLQREVGRTLNMDEAGALGAAYYAARLSPFYNAKSFELREKLSRRLFFTVLPALHSKVLKRPLLRPDSELGTFLSVTLNRSTDFTLIISDETQEDGVEKLTENDIGKISVLNVSEAFLSVPGYNRSFIHENNTHLIRIQLRLSETGLLEVEEVEAVIRYSVNVTTNNLRNTTDSPTEGSSGGNETSVIRVRSRAIPLSYHVDWFKPSYPQQVLERSFQKLKTIDQEETEKHERSNSKNRLELYLFLTSNLLEDSAFLSKVGQNKAKELSNSVAAIKEWIEDGQGSEELCPKREYDSRLESLEKKVQELQEEKTSNNEPSGPSNIERTGAEEDL